MAHENTFGDPQAEIVTSIWFGLAAIRRYPGGPRRLRIRWLRVLGTTLGLGAVAWLLAALALYFFFKLYRGVQTEQFVEDLTLFVPSHFQAHDHEVGEYFLNAGDINLSNHQLNEALNDFRLGVMKVPDNLHGRTILADFYYLYYRGQIDNSLDILQEGLPYAVQISDSADTNKERHVYITDFLLRLQQAHEPEKLEKICLQYLNLPNPNVRDLFALNLASLYIDSGRFDDADALIKKFQLEQLLDGVLLESRLLRESGRIYDAPKYLKEASARFPNNKYIYGLLSGYYRDLGDLDQSEGYILLREEAAPDDPAPRIERLYITAKRGDQAELALETQEITTQFHADASAMTLLASFATDQGNVAFAKSLFDNAQAQYQMDLKTMGKSSFNLASFALLICEAYLTNDDYHGALDYLDSVNAGKPEWLEPNRLLFDSMRAVADYGIGNYYDANTYLTELIKSNTTRPDTLMTIANRFLSHGAFDEAQRILYAAHHLDPHNQAILAQLITTNLQMGNSVDMNQNLKDLLNTRRPPLDLLLDASRQLGSDRFTFVPNREDLLNQLQKYIQDATIKIHQDADNS
jgi:hypothetical protein